VYSLLGQFTLETFIDLILVLLWYTELKPGKLPRLLPRDDDYEIGVCTSVRSLGRLVCGNFSQYDLNQSKGVNSKNKTHPSRSASGMDVASGLGCDGVWRGAGRINNVTAYCFWGYWWESYKGHYASQPFNMFIAFCDSYVRFVS